MTTLEPSSIERFRALLVRRLGLHCDDTRSELVRGVLAARIATTRRDVGDYLDGLEAHPTRDEIAALAVHLTVPETHFFRQVDQLHAFDSLVSEELARQPEPRRLRILVAGCASGEEAYSLAMGLRARSLATERCEIVAIDVSPLALARARAARYSTWSLRETADDVRERWFRRDGHDYVLDPSIVAMVTFEERNLVDDDPGFFREGRFDFVFFRNVLMYFAPDVMRAVVARISHALRPGGYLFLGYAENLRTISREYELCNTHGTFYHRRLASPVPSESPAGTVPAGTPEPDWATAIANASARIERLSRAAGEPMRSEPMRSEPMRSEPMRSEPMRSEPVPSESMPSEPMRSEPVPSEPMRSEPVPSEPVRSEPAAAVMPLDPLRSFADALGLLERERFDEASELVERLLLTRTPRPEVLLLRAVLSMHRGELGVAVSTCEEVLGIDPAHAGAHHLLALCREGEGKTDAAVEHDEIASSLDPDFAMPRLRLGVLARRRGAFAEARRELRDARRLLETEAGERLLLFGGGFRREALVALCDAELLACERVSP